MSGRIRTIKPEVLEDELAAALSDAAWRLWVSLWVLADDHGNARLGDKYLASNVWQDTSRDVDTPRCELIDLGFLTPYAVHGQRYGNIRGFSKHQRVDNAGKARVPGPEMDDGTWGAPGRPSTNIKLLTTGDRALTTNLADSSANFSEHSEGRGSRDTRARIPAAGPRPRPPTPTTDPEDRHTGSSEPSLTDDEPNSETQIAAKPDRGQRDVPASGAFALAAPEPPRAKRATRLSEDWRPSPSTLAWCHEQQVDGLAHLAEFIDHWRGVAGQKGTKLDWDGTFRNRIRALVEQGRAKPWEPPRVRTPEPTPPPPPSPEQAERLREDTRRTLAALRAVTTRQGEPKAVSEAPGAGNDGDLPDDMFSWMVNRAPQG